MNFLYLKNGLREIVNNYNIFSIDLWGVVHDGISLNSSAIEVLDNLRKNNKKFILMTNAPRTRQSVANFLGELEILFPKGYEDMLELSLDNLNYKLENIYKYYNFKKKPLHKKIKEIIVTKINLINKKKNFYKRTFYYLLVPSNYKLMIKQLYKSIDLIWYISGDNSTDFNFYTKRFILFLVYSTVILNFLKNDDLIETEKLLDDNLYKVSKIPKIKEKFKIIKKKFPSLFNILKYYSY